MVGFRAWAGVVLCLGLASAVQSQELPTRLLAEPWPRRERTGVVLSPPPPWPPLGGAGAVASTGPNTVPFPEVRRLGLWPVPPRSQELRAWPAEPASPEPIDPAQFAHALAELCLGRESDDLAEVILSAAETFQVDAFLLAALAHQQSECRAERADAYGIGLTRIHPGMFQRGMRNGVYRFGKPNGRGGFEPAEISVSGYPFTPNALRRARPNAYFAAALISALEQQCPEIDAVFGSAPHRHAISHFVYGDRVRSTLPEDEILIARRRLLQYYAPYSEPPRAHVGNVALSSPLDGAPRLAIGVMGEPRESGKRTHLGIDLGASEGEPVRAMADAVVEFAGVDLRKQGFVALPSENAQRVPPSAMGPRGLFVRLQHADGVETLYVHLASYSVHAGQTIARGQVIGRVGRSGVHTSDSHLHLGIFVDGLPIDPLEPLRSYLVRADRGWGQRLAE